MIGGLADLDGWATRHRGALRARGELLVFDDHPVALCVDGLQRWRNDYFRDRPIPTGSGGSARS